MSSNLLLVTTFSQDKSTGPTVSIKKEEEKKEETKTSTTKEKELEKEKDIIEDSLLAEIAANQDELKFCQKISKFAHGVYGDMMNYVII